MNLKSVHSSNHDTVCKRISNFFEKQRTRLIGRLRYSKANVLQADGRIEGKMHLYYCTFGVDALDEIQNGESTIEMMCRERTMQF